MKEKLVDGFEVFFFFMVVLFLFGKVVGFFIYRFGVVSVV